MRVVKPFEIVNFDKNTNIEQNIIVAEHPVKQQLSAIIISETFTNMTKPCTP